MIVDGRTSKDPDEALNYSIDWSGVIGDDPISSSSWAGETGITVGADSKTDTTTTVLLSGGTAGTTYDVTNTIITTGGQTAQRTLKVRIVEK